MTKKYTIDDVKKAKVKFEKDLLKMVQDFEKEYGIRFGYFNLQRRTDEDEIEPISEQGPVKNVEVNMELDLAY